MGIQPMEMAGGLVVPDETVDPDFEALNEHDRPLPGKGEWQKERG
jgi:hypothetical protein